MWGSKEIYSKPFTSSKITFTSYCYTDLCYTTLFKLIKCKNATTTVLPQSKKGGWVRFSNTITYIPEKRSVSTILYMCLAWSSVKEDQARHIYKMVETDKIINTEAMKQEIEENKMTRSRLWKRGRKYWNKPLPNGYSK